MSLSARHRHFTSNRVSIYPAIADVHFHFFRPLRGPSCHFAYDSKMRFNFPCPYGYRIRTVHSMTLCEYFDSQLFQTSDRGSIDDRTSGCQTKIQCGFQIRQQCLRQNITQNQILREKTFGTLDFSQKQDRTLALFHKPQKDKEEEKEKSEGFKIHISKTHSAVMHVLFL